MQSSNAPYDTPRYRFGPIAAGLAAFGAMLALASPAAAAQASQRCDRACLRQTLDRYVGAVAQHDPSAAPLAPNYRATENQVEVKAGDGLWKSMTGLGELQRRYLDPVTGQAVFYGQIQEGARTSVGLIRVKVVARKVSESEAIIARDGDQMFSAAGALTNAPPADGPIPAAGRVGRQALQKVADSYFEAIDKKNDALVIKKPGCIRVESGTKVTQRAPPGQLAANQNAVEFDNNDCGTGLARMTQIDKAAYRRFPVLDEQAGVAVGTLMFTRPAGSLRANGQPWLRNLLSEVFVVRDGKITAIYAAMHYLDPDRPNGTGWE